MLELQLWKLRLRLDFTFLAVLLLFLLLDQTGLALMGLYACIIHELGHMLAMLIVGSRPDIITLYGAGMKITCYEQYKLPLNKELIVLVFGSMTNLFCFATFMSAGGSYRAMVFATIHLIIGVFNLLPLYGFDGERILIAVLSKRLALDTVRKITQAVSISASFLMLAGAVWLFAQGHVNFTLLITLIYFTLAAIFCPRH